MNSADPGFQSLFDLLPIGAYRAHPEGRLLRANPALVRMSGLASEAELIARIGPGEGEWYVDPARRTELVARLARDGEVRGFVSQARRPGDGSLMWVREHVHLVRDAQGRPLYSEGTVEDITDQIRADAELQDSRQQLQRIADQIPGVMFRTRIDPQGRRHLLYISPGVRELLGVEPAEILADGEALRRTWHPDDVDWVSLATEEAGRQGRTLSIEHRVCLRDGQVKWVHVESTPVACTEEGVEFAGLALDVTARKRAEARLLETEQRWRLALESAGDAVWDWDLGADTEHYTEAFLRLYGYSPGDLSDNPHTLDGLTHPDDVPAMLQAREDHFSGRSPRYVNEHRVRCKDGSWKWVMSRGLVIERDESGRPLRMIGTHTDITPRREAETLRLERDRADAANQAKTALLSRVSHELRTPLNAVLGFAQLLDHDPTLAEPHRRWSGHILQAGRHLLALVDDVLDLSSAQSGQLVIESTELRVSDAVEDAWLLVCASRDDARSRLVRTLAAGLPPLRTDRRRLVQVLVNLLDNALKYNRPDGLVYLSLHTDGPWLLCSVRDEGPGLSPDQVERLFSPFERLDAARRGIGGTGLGLALSRQLARTLGGELRVQCAPGQGACFTLQLPLATPSAASGTT